MTTATTDIFDALAAAPVLTGMTVEGFALIAEEGKLREFTAGEIIVHEGELGHAFFILASGRIEVVKRAGTPGEVHLCTLMPGEFFGEMCILAPMPRAASIRAVDQVRALEIQAATLHHLYKKMPDQYSIVLLNLARDLARRLSRIDDAYIARA